jgi:hypothetical protein
MSNQAQTCRHWSWGWEVVELNEFRLPKQTLLEEAGRFAVCRLPHGSSVPPWVGTSSLYSIVQTRDELSVICREEVVPEGVECEPDWRCIRVAGAMPFTMTGVLASITLPLAQAGISVFAFSTFDTDYLLVKADCWQAAREAWRQAGHVIQDSAA